MYVLIADLEAENYKKDLEKKFPDLSIHAVPTMEGIRDHAAKMEVLVTILRVTDDLLKQAVNLKWIQILGTGVNYILGRPSLRKDVIITSCRGIHGPQMSEMALLFMLALNRNFPQMVRNQDQQRWERWPGKLLLNKKVGILGIGVIGEEIARKCKAFGMTVYAMDIVKRELPFVDFFSGPEDLPRVAGQIDFLILVAPSTPETEGIVGATVLGRMKPTSFLINLARGELVDETELMEALEAGKIAGAALDALATEPLPKDHPLWTMKNVIITPHIGGTSDVYREQVMPIVEENLRRFIKGERKSLINYIQG